MTSNHAHKRLVRDRMAATGETYTQARQQLEPEPPTCIEVFVRLGVVCLNAKRREAWLAAERQEEGSGRKLLNDLVSAYLKEQQEAIQEEDGDEILDDGAISYLTNCGIDIEDLDEQGFIDDQAHYVSTENALYGALNGHKARALGITIDEYRERERWLSWEITEAEEKWLVDTGRIITQDVADVPVEDQYYTRVDGELVFVPDETMLQFLAEYKAHVSAS